MAQRIPYAPIRRHGLIGDRRTAALVAADGTIDWMCAPDYASPPVFAALIDDARGGYARFAPRSRRWGEQRYLDGTAVLETRFAVEGGEVILRDAMTLPDDDRAEDDRPRRVIVRHLVARARRARCILDVAPFEPTSRLHVFCSGFAGDLRGPVEFDLAADEEAWAILAYDDDSTWTAARARAALEDTVLRWRAWSERLRIDVEGPRRARAMRSLITIRLLGHAPSGGLVAAPTTSLPERIGGDWNADYRFAWVRDGSLTLEALARHGDHATAKRYFDWLTRLESAHGAPLRVLYPVGVDAPSKEREQGKLSGYRGSVPVRFGNHAEKQKQLGMVGFFADCAKAYRDHGGDWRPEYFDLVARAADHVAAHWDEADNGIWELASTRRRVASRVMSWVALTRASAIADALGQSDRAEPWKKASPAVREDVLAHGYSQRRGAFAECLDGEALDASALLIPICRFLPGDDPRVVSTVDRIAADLTINGWVHRFVPAEVEVEPALAMGDYEGSFLLCTCWLASAYAIGGRLDEAESVLDKIDRVIGDLGLMPEGIDARDESFLGNYPLLFSHAEYVRAVVELERARRKAEGR